MSRTAIQAAIIVGCFGAAAVLFGTYLLRGSPGTDAEVRDVIENGQHVHVICTNADCRFEQADYRAHADDRDWPKACPRCSARTLCRAVRCYRCGQWTAWQADDRGRVYCQNCRTWLNPPPEGAEGPASP